MSKAYDELYKKIKSAKKIVISRHKQADGDCVGSQYALYYFIKKNFPRKEVFRSGYSTEHYLRHLFPHEYEKKAVKDIEDFDLQIIVDTSAISRIDDKLHSNKKKVVVIDHHKFQEPMGDLEIRKNYSSACELIAEILFYFEKNKNLKVNLKVARSLFIGIITDTNRFWYQLNPKTLKMSARLLKYGFQTQKIFEVIFHWSLEEIKFRNRLVERATIQGNVIWVILETKEFAVFDINYQTAKDLALTLMTVKEGMYFLIAVRNPSTNLYHVSLRSKDKPIDAIARKYGGGGHERASGVKIATKAKVKLLLSDLKEYARVSS